MKYYIIKSLKINKYYYANIHKDDECYIVSVGGINNICVNIIVYKKLKNAIIQDISYKPKCSYFEDFKKGKETIDMIKCSLKFVTQIFDKIKEFELIDNSNIKCKNKLDIYLSNLYYIKYKKTWYEKTFGTIPKKETKSEVEDAIKNIKQKLKKKFILPLDKFIEKYYNFLSEDYNDKKIFKKISKVYKENIKIKNYLKFFMTKKYDCIYYQNILKNEIGRGLFGTSWIINKKTIDKYNVKFQYVKTDKLKGNKNVDKLRNKLNDIKESNYLIDIQKI